MLKLDVVGFSGTRGVHPRHLTYDPHLLGGSGADIGDRNGAEVFGSAVDRPFRSAEGEGIAPSLRGESGGVVDDSRPRAGSAREVPHAVLVGEDSRIRPMEFRHSRISDAAGVIIGDVEAVLVVARELGPIGIPDVFHRFDSFSGQVDRLDAGFGGRGQLDASLEHLESPGNADGDDDQYDHGLDDGASLASFLDGSHGREG